MPGVVPHMSAGNMNPNRLEPRRPSISSVQSTDTRGRLNSNGAGVKRIRVDPTDSTRSKHFAKNKTVIGTASSANTGRKMRSPPADIFVWGIHPETSKEDIVKDLAQCDIVIEEKDVVKKSKEGAALLSFKISVRAEDLQKALHPTTWPIRVKVREYIYYPKKTSETNKTNSTNPTQQVPNVEVHPPSVSDTPGEDMVLDVTNNK